jgi:hypothetical protein
MFAGDYFGDFYKRIAYWISSFDLLVEPRVLNRKYLSLIPDINFSAEFRERLSPIDSDNYEFCFYE